MTRVRVDAPAVVSDVVDADKRLAAVLTYEACEGGTRTVVLAFPDDLRRAADACAVAAARLYAMANDAVSP